MDDVSAGDCSKVDSWTERQRPNSRKGIADVGSGYAGTRHEPRQTTKHVINFARRWLRIFRVGIGDLGGAHQHLAIPWKDEERPLIHCFGVDCLSGSAAKSWQN